MTLDDQIQAYLDGTATEADTQAVAAALRAAEKARWALTISFLTSMVTCALGHFFPVLSSKVHFPARWASHQ